MKQGDPYGTHRVLEPPGALPQPAQKIDNNPELYHNEILIDVDTLNIDSASFTQIQHTCAGDHQKIRDTILHIVSTRGKMHNPVTGSGGMLIGTVAQIGPGIKDNPAHSIQPRDRIATLVSLSLTPLYIEEILSIKPDIDQVQIKGKAILFESGMYAKLPEDFPESLALAVLDVAGAPAQTARLVGPGDRVLIIGAGGKSSLLCLHEAKKRAGCTGQVAAACYSQEDLQRVQESGLADIIFQADATDAVGTYQAYQKAAGDDLADLVINTVNIPNTEMASILCTRNRGRIYFFSMATSFTAAALGAEGVGKDIDMLIGNGYAQGHGDIALGVLRENKTLRSMFTRLYT